MDHRQALHAAGRGEAFIALVAGISLGAVMLGVAALVIVMSVMNGFRAELLDKIVGLNGHAIIQAYGGRLDNWQAGPAGSARRRPAWSRASPLIEQPLLATFNGRVEAMLVRGNTAEDIDRLAAQRAAWAASRSLQPDAGKVAIGSAAGGEPRRAGRRHDHRSSIPQGRATPFGTVPRQVGYTVGAIFEIGVYDYDETFVVMPIADAQTLLLTGDTIGMIEVKTDDADKVGRIPRPAGQAARGPGGGDRLEDRSTPRCSRRWRSSGWRCSSRCRSSCWWRRSTSCPVADHAGARQDPRHRDHAHDGRDAQIAAQDLRHHRLHRSARSARWPGWCSASWSCSSASRSCNVIQALTGQNLWDPSIRFLSTLPARPDPVEIVGDRAAGAGAQLPRHALPGVQGGEHRSGPGAAL